jgi:hypothetical protein
MRLRTFTLYIAGCALNVVLFFATDEWVFLTLATLILLFLEIHVHHSDRQRFKRIETELMEELNGLR